VLNLVRGQDIVPTLHPLFLAFRGERVGGEHFGDFCHRIGLERARRLMTNPPLNGNDAAFYVVRNDEEGVEREAALA